MVKPLRLSDHARVVTAERLLDPVWVERTTRFPDWVAADPEDGTVERRFAVVPERGDRILRVACRETPDEIFVLSCFLDRKARRP